MLTYTAHIQSRAPFWDPSLNSGNTEKSKLESNVTQKMIPFWKHRCISACSEMIGLWVLCVFISWAKWIPMKWNDPFAWKTFWMRTQTNCLLNDKVNEHTLHIPLAQHLRRLHQPIGRSERKVTNKRKMETQCTTSMWSMNRIRFECVNGFSIVYRWLFWHSCKRFSHRISQHSIWILELRMPPPCVRYSDNNKNNNKKSF